MRVLFIGGSGEISPSCIREALQHGHDVTVFNRGNNNAMLPEECRFIRGDIENDSEYTPLSAEHFDVVCQFRLFSPAAMARDIKLFAGNCGQYVFISSASAYAKPVRNLPITEATPLDNPYWQYSRDKTAMERLLQSQNTLTYTIVRPSHTYRAKFPTPLGGEVSRMLRGKPVVMHGDGESLWTLTHADDFARPFVKLLGNSRAMNDHFHITGDRQWTWNEIMQSIAAALDIQNAQFVHVASDTLVRYNPEWEGPLLGDKSASVVFDNSKVKSVAGNFDCPIDPWIGMRMVAKLITPKADDYNAAADVLYDRIVAEQRALGD